MPGSLIGGVPSGRRSSGAWCAVLAESDQAFVRSHHGPVAFNAKLIERGIKAHQATVVQLATFLSAHGHEPRLCGAAGPQYDLAWRFGATTFVAESKSLTHFNEADRLRLGLGQVLWYRTLLENDGMTVKALVVTEKGMPHDDRWAEVCASVGVSLVWPGAFDDILGLMR